MAHLSGHAGNRIGIFGSGELLIRNVQAGSQNCRNKKRAHHGAGCCPGGTPYTGTRLFSLLNEPKHVLADGTLVRPELILFRDGRQPDQLPFDLAGKTNSKRHMLVASASKMGRYLERAAVRFRSCSTTMILCALGL